MALSNAPLAAGVDASYWRHHVQSLPVWDPPPPARLIVIAPHPDDEVLGCSGLLQRWAQANTSIELWMVTDGEACFGEALPTARVAGWRREEARLAHERLNMNRDNCLVRWLGIPDGKVREHLDGLWQLIVAAVTPGTTLLAPMRNDFHPDHVASGEAAFLAAEATGARLVSYPVWLLYRGHEADLHQLPGPVVRFCLTASEQWRKHDAIAAFTSQIEPVTNNQPILPRSVLRHFYNAHEVFHIHPARTHAHQP